MFYIYGQMFMPTLQEQMYNLRAQAAVYMLCHEGNLAILPSIKKLLKKTKVSILSLFFFSLKNWAVHSIIILRYCTLVKIDNNKRIFSIVSTISLSSDCTFVFHLLYFLWSKELHHHCSLCITLLDASFHLSLHIFKKAY